MEEKKELSEQELEQISGGKANVQQSGLRDNARELRERSKNAANQDDDDGKGRSDDLRSARR